jgi:hypothetical protein
MKNLSFRSWLLEQVERNDPVGDLARDFQQDIRDGCLGGLRSFDSVSRHIHSRHTPVPGARSALHRANDECEAYRGH